MRSVNVERKSRAKARTQTVRPASKSRRDLPAVQPGSARHVASDSSASIVHCSPKGGGVTHRGAEGGTPL